MDGREKRRRVRLILCYKRQTDRQTRPTRKKDRQRERERVGEDDKNDRREKECNAE